MLFTYFSQSYKMVRATLDKQVIAFFGVLHVTKLHFMFFYTISLGVGFRTLTQIFKPFYHALTNQFQT